MVLWCLFYKWVINWQFGHIYECLYEHTFKAWRLKTLWSRNVNVYIRSKHMRLVQSSYKLTDWNLCWVANHPTDVSIWLWKTFFLLYIFHLTSKEEKNMQFFASCITVDHSDSIETLSYWEHFPTKCRDDPWRYGYYAPVSAAQKWL